MNKLLDKLKFVIGTAASADMNDTNPVSDAVRVNGAEEILYLLTSVATTGTATITVEACSAADGTGAEAIPFYSRFIDSAGSPVDALGSESTRTAAGFTTTASKTGIYILRVAPSDVPATKPFLRVKHTEVVNAAVIGAGVWMLGGLRYAPSGSVVA